MHIERDFLRKLEGGCTAPIGALAQIKNNIVHFKGALFSLDGTQKIEIEKEIPLAESKNIGITFAEELLANGGTELMQQIKKEMNK